VQQQQPAGRRNEGIPGGLGEVDVCKSAMNGAEDHAGVFVKLVVGDVVLQEGDQLLVGPQVVARHHDHV